jgi:hypothetical protein
VCRILKGSGEWKPEPNKAKGKPRLWLRTGGFTGGLKSSEVAPSSPVPSPEQLKLGKEVE